MFSCLRILINSFRNASESNCRLGRCNMSVGGVLRSGSGVGVTVAVCAGVTVIVGQAVAVEVIVGRNVGVLTGCSISGTGAICATGVQALLQEAKMRKRSARCFKDIPPSDEVSCCFNGNIYSVGAKRVS